jgi:hypothetical protein
MRIGAIFLMDSVIGTQSRRDAERRERKRTRQFRVEGDSKSIDQTIRLAFRPVCFAHQEQGQRQAARGLAGWASALSEAEGEQGARKWILWRSVAINMSAHWAFQCAQATLGFDSHPSFVANDVWRI